MHNYSYENEFTLHVNEISFSYEKMGTKTRFEEEAKGIRKWPILTSDINECAPAPCQNGGTCLDFVGSYHCDCKAGYSGTNCETGDNNLSELLFSK